MGWRAFTLMGRAMRWYWAHRWAVLAAAVALGLLAVAGAGRAAEPAGAAPGDGVPPVASPGAGWGEEGPPVPQFFLGGSAGKGAVCEWPPKVGEPVMCQGVLRAGVILVCRYRPGDGWRCSTMGRIGPGAPPGAPGGPPSEDAEKLRL